MQVRDVRDALRIHPVARRLPLRFDPGQLLADLQSLDEGWWEGHLGPFHDGGWESIALWAPGGSRRAQRSRGAPFARTEALDRCPYLETVIDAVPGPKNRVRLLRLLPGTRILRHTDPVHQISRDLLRLHVPIVTAPEVRFLVRDRPVVMRPGELWHLDVRFPHEVRNDADVARVHLVIDVLHTPALGALLDRSVVQGRGFLFGYYATYALPDRLRSAWESRMPHRPRTP